MLSVIRDELLTIKAKYGDDRKTAIELAEDEFNAEDLIPNEAAVIAMTKLGYIKRMSPDHFKAQNRGGKGIKGMNILDEDYIADLITINNHDYVLFFTNLGRVYQLKGYEIPEASRTARGTAVIDVYKRQAQAMPDVLFSLPCRQYSLPAAREFPFFFHGNSQYPA